MHCTGFSRILPPETLIRRDAVGNDHRMGGPLKRPQIVIRLMCGLPLLALGCGTNPVPVPTGPFSRLIAFGDSLTDTGNLLGQSLFLPPEPYYFGRLTNGEAWVEHVARHYGLEARPSYGGGTNYAQGAATTGIGLSTFDALALGPNILEQVRLYRGVPDGTELFVIWGGAVDIFDILSGECVITMEQAAENIATAIADLHGRGARQFLVPNLPDLGHTPRYSDTPRKASATEMTIAFNAALAARLDELDALPDIKIYRLDVAAMFEEAIANPPPGITNVTDPAWTGSLVGYLGEGEVAPDADAYLFWDFVHPTRIGHGFIAAAAIETIDRELVTPVRHSEATSAQPPGSPFLDFWGTYFYYLLQPPSPPEECRF